MEEILSLIEEKGLTIELWDSIQDIGIKLNIIADYDISNIYWHIVNTDPEILQKGNKIYKERQEIKEKKDELERLITSNIKNVNLFEIWADIESSYSKPERIEYAKRLIDSGKNVEIESNMYELLVFTDHNFLEEITEYKIEKKHKLSAPEAFRILRTGDAETINRILDSGIDMNTKDIQEANKRLKIREASDDSDKLEYTQELKDKLFENFIKYRTDAIEQGTDDETIEIFNIDVLKKVISEGVNVSDRFILSHIYGLSLEEKRELLNLKLDNKLPLSGNELGYSSLCEMDVEEVIRKHLDNNGDITGYTMTYIHDEDERIKLLLKHSKQIKNIERNISAQKDISQKEKEVYKAYISNAKNIYSANFYKYFYILDIKDNEEKHRIISSYLKNVQDTELFSVADILQLFNLGEDDDKEKILLQCIDLDLPIENDHLALISSADKRYEVIMKDLEKGKFSFRLSPGKLEFMTQEQKYEILNKAIQKGYKVNDDFWDCYESIEERENAIKEYVAKRGKIEVLKNVDSINIIQSEEERLELIKANMLNGGEPFYIPSAKKILEKLTDDGKIKLINLQLDYEKNLDGYSLFSFVGDVDKRIDGRLEYLYKRGKILEIGEDLKSVIAKYTQSIDSKQNKEYKEVLQERLVMLKETVDTILKGSEYEISESVMEVYNRIKGWEKRNIIPEKVIFDKVPSNKIEEFDYKIWNNLVKSVNKDLKDEEKGALVEIAYVFGLFDKNLKTARGVAKTDDEMTQEEKMQKSAWENYEARKSNVIKFINSLESIDDLHEMFDGMGMDFNPKFYHFFMLNKEDIKNNIELVEDQSLIEGIVIDSLQNELKNIYGVIDKIEELYRTGTPTIKQCTNYLIQLRKEIANRRYEKIEEGNNELARLCALCGCMQETFEQYQHLYNISKGRNTSSIPRIKATKKIEVIEDDESKKVTVEKNKSGNDQLKIEIADKKISFEILKMDDPRATVCGEKIFSNCCQRLGGAGQECLMQSQHSKNGGILEIKAEDGTFLGQSWCWVNGNVLCFDSAELKGLDQNKNMTDTQKEEYLKMIKIGYEQMAKRMLEESNKKVEEYIKAEKAKAKQEYGENSLEYKQKEEEIEAKADIIRIKQVTIGKGYWDISLKLSKLYEDDKRIIDGKREEQTLASPIEKVNYLQDSDVQYELARLEGVENKDIRYDLHQKEQEHIYSDNRNVIKQSGIISRDVLSKVKHIEEKAHNEDTQIMQNMDMSYGVSLEESLAIKYRANKDDLSVVCGEDWYLVYSKSDENIVVHDIAKAKETRIEGEEEIATDEIKQAFYEIMEEALKSDKKLTLQFRQGEEYDLYQQLIEDGHIEQTGEKIEDVIYKKNYEKVDIHEIEYKVTQKGKKAIEDLKKDEDMEL